MKQIFVVLLLFCFYPIFANDNALLDEYNLLYIDLSNIMTYGYKSYFNHLNNEASKRTNTSQGLLATTRVNTDISIVGEGFFKIRLENDIIGYTRDGRFFINSDGNFVTKHGYFLYNNISLPPHYLYDSIRIISNGNVFVNIVENNRINEINVGRFLTYNIPSEYLAHYKEAIYVIDDNIEYNEEIILNNQIINGTLEFSNVQLLPVILRMNYILTVINENLISNIELKKDLLKVQIDYMANTFSLENLLFSINNNIVSIYDLLEDSNLFNTENESNINDMELNLEERLLRILFTGRNRNRIVNIINFDFFYTERYSYLRSILPYLKYSY
jgi:flagellar basal body rod protein FlgF